MNEFISRDEAYQRLHDAGGVERLTNGARDMTKR